MKWPLLSVALIYVGGLLLGDFLRFPLTWLFAVSFGAAILTLAWGKARRYLLALLIALAGWTNLTTRTALLSPHDLRTVVGTNVEYVTLRGRLCATPTMRVYEHDDTNSSRTLARVDVAAFARGTNWQPAFGRIAVVTPGILGPDYFGGRIVELTGVMRPPPGPVAEGLFDYRTYLRRQGIHHELRVEATNDWRFAATDTNRTKPPIADRFTRWARATLARGLPVEADSLRLLWAMALGWSTGLTDEVAEPFMRSGTMHIFAISGLHIALIAGIVVAVLRVLRMPRAACGLVVVPLIWFYTAATGWQPSAVRSTIMMSVVIAGWSLKRPSELLNSLATAAFIILLWDPQQLFQASFQLSFFVVASIALLLPPIEKARQHLLKSDPLLPPELRPRWRRWLDAPIRYLSTSFAISLAAWLGSLPLIAHYFHLFTPVSLLANVVVVPLAGFALMCSLGSLLCGAWCPWLTELFNHSGWFWMTAMVRFSEWFAALPAAFAYVPSPTLAGFAVYYALLFGTLTGWLLAAQRRLWTGAAIGLIAVVGIANWQQHRRDTRITIIPVRGGDSIFADAAGRANDLLVDCGNESATKFLVQPFLRGQGVNRLPRLVLTHGDLRHVGGANDVLTNFGVREVFTSDIPFRSPRYREIVGDLEREDLRATRREIHRGDKLGNWAVLHPGAGNSFTEADDGALVMRGEFHGVRVLLCSDLGRPGQRALLESNPDLRSDVVVCGIPTRGEPLFDALLDAVQPRAIIVSASEVPSQERATKELRERLESRGVPVFYTSDDGAATIGLRPNGWEVRAMSGKRVLGKRPDAVP